MSKIQFATGWLTFSATATIAAVAWLRPLMERVVEGEDDAVKRRRRGTVGAVMAAVVASLAAAFLYPLSGLLMPSLVGWHASFIVNMLIALPILAFGAMTIFARTGVEQFAPSWRSYLRFFWRVGVLLAVLVVLPVALHSFGWPGCVYPVALFTVVFAGILDAFRTPRGRPDAAGGVT